MRRNSPYSPTTVHRPFDTRIFHKECQTLSRAGYRVSLIASHPDRETIDGVEIIPVPHFDHRLARMTRGIWAVYLLARRLGADLYHFHDPELLPIGILLKLTTRARVIYDVHENHPKKIWAREWLPRPLHGLASWGIKALEAIMGALADGIITATEHIAVRFPDRKSRIVKNYPLLDMVSPAAKDRRTYQDNYTLIYTGGFTDYRGIYQIIQALEYVKTPRARLLLLGKTISQHTAEAAQKLPGFEKVDYSGLVPYEEMYRCLRSAAVGLVCNQPIHDYDLAQPNKLFEYMSAGLPVIASNFELWKKIIEGDECGLTVDPTAPQQIAEAIDYLLDHPERRRAMGENARKAIQEKYNWEHESVKLFNLYQEVLRQC